MKSLYKNGARKEYYVVSKLKGEGWDIVQRSAGSHSPVDIFAINIKDKKILLVQCKRSMTGKMSFIDQKLKEKLELENKELNGTFEVKFEAK